MRICSRTHLKHNCCITAKKYKKNETKTEAIISAKTVCTISLSYLCTFIAFSTCCESLRLSRDAALSSLKIFIRAECHWSFGHLSRFKKKK